MLTATEMQFLWARDFYKAPKVIQKLSLCELTLWQKSLWSAYDLLTVRTQQCPWAPGSSLILPFFLSSRLTTCYVAWSYSRGSEDNTLAFLADSMLCFSFLSSSTCIDNLRSYIYNDWLWCGLKSQPIPLSFQSKGSVCEIQLEDPALAGRNVSTGLPALEA